jgi:hypothetical protein
MILQNAIRIIDIDKVLISFTTHDYVEFEGYFVDGGHEYQKFGHPAGKQDNVENLIIYHTDDLNTLKKNLLWGTYGIDGLQPLKFIKLISADTDHLKNILKLRNLTYDYLKIIESILEDKKMITRKNKILKIINKNII